MTCPPTPSSARSLQAGQRLVFLLQQRGIELQLRGRDVFVANGEELTAFDRLSISLFLGEIRSVLEMDARPM